MYLSYTFPRLSASSWDMILSTETNRMHVNWHLPVTLLHPACMHPLPPSIQSTEARHTLKLNSSPHIVGTKKKRGYRNGCMYNVRYSIRYLHLECVCVCVCVCVWVCVFTDKNTQLFPNQIICFLLVFFFFTEKVYTNWFPESKSSAKKQQQKS